jgi:nitroreductase
MTTPESVHEWIRSRRSTFISQFEAGKNIPDEWVMEILENANHAPTHKLTEPWRFTVFSGAGLQQLAEAQATTYKNEAGEKFKQATYDKLLQQPLQCSHVIAIGLKRNESVPLMEEIAAVGCAVENIYLSLPAYGIGGYWSTGGITFYAGAKKLFGLEENDLLMGFFFLGFVKTPSVYRRPGALTEKLTWVKG